MTLMDGSHHAFAYETRSQPHYNHQGEGSQVIAPQPQVKNKCSMIHKHCAFITLDLNKAAVVEKLQRWQ